MKTVQRFIEEEWKVLAYGSMAVVYCLVQPSMATAFAVGFWGGAVVAMIAGKAK